MFDEIYTIANSENPNWGLIAPYLENLDARDTKPPFHTAASKLAAEGKHEKVEIFRIFGANVNLIASGYASAGDHENVERYRIKHHADVNLIAQGYAYTAQDDKVELYRTQYLVNATEIVLAYALAGNHDKVEWYRSQFQANVNAIAFGYAAVNNHDKVKFYEEHYNVIPEQIAAGYALVAKTAKVEAYKSSYWERYLVSFALPYALSGQHSKIQELHALNKSYSNPIAYAYALAGNHRKVKEYQNVHAATPLAAIEGYINAGYYLKVKQYRSKYDISCRKIAEIYANKPQSAYIPPFYQAINKIARYYQAAQLGDQIIDAMSRLKQGEGSWNPYWMNSSIKLERIVDAILKLPKDAKLQELVKDSNSELYKALNMQRISPITLFGQLGYNQSKTLTHVQKEPEINISVFNK